VGPVDVPLVEAVGATDPAFAVLLGGNPRLCVVVPDVSPATPETPPFLWGDDFGHTTETDPTHFNVSTGSPAERASVHRVHSAPFISEGRLLAGMKRSLEEHAARFDEKAPDYDNERRDEVYRAAVSLVVDHADPGSAEVVLDVGTGTGVVALALAGEAGRVVGRDISEGMLEQARAKADARGADNVTFGEGRFREPGIEAADVVTSNFAMHHLGDDEKRAAIEVIASLGPRRVVLGDVMLFGGPDPAEPHYDPEVDDPATVGTLVEFFTDAGFAVTAAERVHDQVGVLVADVRGGDSEPRPGAR
jgi:SAM-dependent methyltransferase